MSLISRGFSRRRPLDPLLAERLPPGQHLVGDFPVLAVGPTPRTPLEEWTLKVDGAVGRPRVWTWEEFRALPSRRFQTDIHCVTSWSKLDTVWEGVSLDVILEGIQTTARYLIAVCDGGYTTNLPLADVTGAKAWIAYWYNDQPLAAEHGGPARLERGDPTLDVRRVLTQRRPGEPSSSRRLNHDRLSELAYAPELQPAIFVCGPTGFVETVTAALVELGHDANTIHAERFGPTGEQHELRAA